MQKGVPDPVGGQGGVEPRIELISLPEPKANRMGVEPASVCLSFRLSMCASVNTFNNEYLCNQRANRNEIISEVPFWREKGCIWFWARSDQNSGSHGNKQLP